MSPPDVRRAFDAVPYLRALSGEIREALARASVVRHIDRGSPLFEQDAEATGIFILTAGRVRIVRGSEDGREQVLHEERAGSTLAEAPVFGGGGYVGSAVAADDTTVVFVPRRELLDAVSRTPASAAEVIRILAKRVRTLAALAADLSLRDVASRTATFLIREMDRAGSPAFDLPDTREQLASHVGTVREQVSRALSHFKASGVIELTGSRVVIRDRERLEATSAGRTKA